MCSCRYGKNALKKLNKKLKNNKKTLKKMGKALTLSMLTDIIIKCVIVRGTTHC